MVGRTVDRVLVVDDDGPTGEVLVEILRNLGYEARFASSGAKTHALIPEFRPHLILLDYRMPEMDGQQLARALRQQGCDAVLCMMSASPTGEDVAEEIGAFGWLAKPFEFEDVERLIAAGIRHWAATHDDEDAPVAG